MANKNQSARKAQSRRKNKRRRRVSSAAVMICTLLVLAGILGVMLLLNPPGKTDVAAMSVPATTPAQPTLAPVTAEPTDPPTQAPTAAPTAEPTEEPVTASELLGFGKPSTGASDSALQTADGVVDGGEGGFEYLPVYKQAATTENRIAITVDDCFQVDNLRTIISCAYKNNGRLTIFPIGENLGLPKMAETLQAAVKVGFEIENHTWSHSRIFRMAEEDMAAEIWKQSQALNQTLGMNYQEHFFRLMGGDGANDQRTHNYLSQLGFKGIAEWSLSGSDADLNWIESSLAPGMIYLFHTTDRDTGILQQFIPYAVSKGYELVTMNELLGFPENETSAFTTAEMPEPRAYEVDYHTHKEGDYAWIIVQMQDVLRAQGYLVIDGPSTGYYGKQTAEAVRAYQEAHGLPATGQADAATQMSILGVTT